MAWMSFSPRRFARAPSLSLSVPDFMESRLFFDRMGIPSPLDNAGCACTIIFSFFRFWII